MDWIQILTWLITSVVGGLIVMGYDILRDKVKKRASERELKNRFITWIS